MASVKALTADSQICVDVQLRGYITIASSMG